MNIVPNSHTVVETTYSIIFFKLFHLKWIALLEPITANLAFESLLIPDCIKVEDDHGLFSRHQLMTDL